MNDKTSTKEITSTSQEKQQEFDDVDTNYLCMELLKEKNNLIDIREIKEKANRYAADYVSKKTNPK